MMSSALSRLEAVKYWLRGSTWPARKRGSDQKMST